MKLAILFFLLPDVLQAVSVAVDVKQREVVVRVEVDVLVDVEELIVAKKSLAFLLLVPWQLCRTQTKTRASRNFILSLLL
jgi:hypothetical protein